MLDNETGEALYQRADDTAEALKTRLVPPRGAAGERAPAAKTAVPGRVAAGRERERRR